MTSSNGGPLRDPEGKGLIAFAILMVVSLLITWGLVSWPENHQHADEVAYCKYMGMTWQSSDDATFSCENHGIVVTFHKRRLP